MAGQSRTSFTLVVDVAWNKWSPTVISETTWWIVKAEKNGFFYDNFDFAHQGSTTIALETVLERVWAWCEARNIAEAHMRNMVDTANEAIRVQVEA